MSEEQFQNRKPKRTLSYEQAKSTFKSLEDRAMARNLQDEYWSEKKSWNQTSFKTVKLDREMAMEHQRREEELLQQHQENLKKMSEEDQQLAVLLSKEEFEKHKAEREKRVAAEEEHFQSLLKKEQDRYEKEAQEQRTKKEVKSALITTVHLPDYDDLDEVDGLMSQLDSDLQLAERLQSEEEEAIRRDERLARQLSENETRKKSTSYDDDAKLALELAMKEAELARRQSSSKIVDEEGEEYGF